MKSAIFVLLFVAALQYATATSRAALLVKYGKLALELEVNTTKAWTVEGVKITNETVRINGRILKAQAEAELKLGALDKDIVEANLKALSAGKSIVSCVANVTVERTKKVHPSTLFLCEKAIDQGSNQVRLAKILAVKAVAATFVSKCVVLHPLDNRKLENCLEDNVVRGRSIIETNSASIDASLDEMEVQSTQCVDEKKVNLLENIRVINENFDKCVDKKLNPDDDNDDDNDDDDNNDDDNNNDDDITPDDILKFMMRL